MAPHRPYLQKYQSLEDEVLERDLNNIPLVSSYFSGFLVVVGCWCGVFVCFVWVFCGVLMNDFLLISSTKRKLLLCVGTSMFIMRMLTK